MKNLRYSITLLLFGGLHKIIYRVGLGFGVPIGGFFSNKLQNKIFYKDEKTQRKTNPKDFFVHVDDLLAPLAMVGISFAKKILPLAYIISGYEAGKK